METVTIRSATTSQIYLSLSAFALSVDEHDYYAGAAVHVELAVVDLRAASTVVPPYADDFRLLPAFFEEMNRDWRGWSGAKVWNSPDSDYVALSATHDGKGHVLLMVHLVGESRWESQPDAWKVRAGFDLDIGSMDRIAAEVRAWCAAVWPVPQARSARTNR